MKPVGKASGFHKVCGVWIKTAIESVAVFSNYNTKVSSQKR